MLSNLLSGVPSNFRGAIISIDKSKLASQMILFQYNPHQWSRTLEPQAASVDGNYRSEVLRFKGAPIETINLEIEIDATDQLDTASYTGTYLGIYPQLSALEMLTYPSSQQILRNTALLKAGGLEIIADDGPLTFIVWGYKRVLPIRINTFTITEEAYDSDLSPIRARVALSLRVLSYNDLPANSTGYYLYLANQVAKEAMSKLNNIKI